MLEYWLLGLAMMLIIEGLLPFMFPKAWREAFSKLTQLSDGQIRSMALFSIGLGLMLLMIVK